jgi:hypothetical protein
MPAYFSEIKKGLNPLRSYVIFERPAGSGDEESLMEVITSFGDLKTAILSWKTYRDEEEKMVMLVVELGPDDKDRVLQALLGFDLPEEVSFYAYGPRSAQ